MDPKHRIIKGLPCMLIWVHLQEQSNFEAKSKGAESDSLSGKKNAGF